MRRSKSPIFLKEKKERLLPTEHISELSLLKAGDLSPKINKKIERALDNYKFKMTQKYGENYATNRNLNQRFMIENTDQFKVEIPSQNDQDLIEKAKQINK